MKVKDFFKTVDCELNKVVPKMSEEVKNAPIVVCDTQEEIVVQENKSFSLKEFFTPKRLGVFATVLVVAFVAVFGSLSFAGAFSKVSNGAVVSIDINPSFELLLGKNMKVEKVVSTNADGDVILTEEGLRESLVGKSVEEALKIIAQKASDYGFIDYKNLGDESSYNKITVTATGNKEKLPKGFTEDISTALNNYFCESGIYVYVEVATKKAEEYLQKAEELNKKQILFHEAIKKDLTALGEYLSELIFDYCNVLLLNSLDQYDLLMQVEELNEQIKSMQDGFFPVGYWSYTGSDEEVLKLCATVKEKLDLLYNAHGVEIDSEIGLMTSMLIYSQDIDIEGLKELSLSGIDENLFDLQNDLLGDFMVISAEDFIGDVIEFYGEISISSESGILEKIDLLIAKLEQVRKNAGVRPQLEVITSENYALFMQRIGK